mmetsp:Transcript_6982/g.11815  ORF Transcript_6982/g.11815 Transcript_6982/m.11815 type:complete len:846 (-) Transcript_6982:76-2613(-)
MLTLKETHNQHRLFVCGAFLLLVRADKGRRIVVVGARGAGRRRGSAGVAAHGAATAFFILDKIRSKVRNLRGGSQILGKILSDFHSGVQGHAELHQSEVIGSLEALELSSAPVCHVLAHFLTAEVALLLVGGLGDGLRGSHRRGGGDNRLRSRARGRRRSNGHRGGENSGSAAAGLGGPGQRLAGSTGGGGSALDGGHSLTHFLLLHNIAQTALATSGSDRRGGGSAPSRTGTGRRRSRRCLHTQQVLQLEAHVGGSRGRLLGSTGLSLRLALTGRLLLLLDLCQTRSGGSSTGTRPALGDLGLLRGLSLLLLISTGLLLTLDGQERLLAGSVGTRLLVGPGSHRGGLGCGLSRGSLCGSVSRLQTLLLQHEPLLVEQSLLALLLLQKQLLTTSLLFLLLLLELLLPQSLRTLLLELLLLQKVLLSGVLFCLALLLLKLLLLTKKLLLLLLLQGQKQAASRLRGNTEECILRVREDGLEDVEASPVAQLDGQISVEVAGLVPGAHVVLLEGALHVALRVRVQPFGRFHPEQRRHGGKQRRVVVVQRANRVVRHAGGLLHNWCRRSRHCRLDIESLQQQTSLGSGLGCGRGNLLRGPVGHLLLILEAATAGVLFAHKAVHHVLLTTQAAHFSVGLAAQFHLLHFSAELERHCCEVAQIQIVSTAGTRGPSIVPKTSFATLRLASCSAPVTRHVFATSLCLLLSSSKGLSTTTASAGSINTTRGTLLFQIPNSNDVFRLEAFEANGVQAIKGNNLNHLSHVGQKFGRLAEGHHFLLSKADHFFRGRRDFILISFEILSRQRVLRNKSPSLCLYNPLVILLVGINLIFRNVFAGHYCYISLRVLFEGD